MTKNLTIKQLAQELGEEVVYVTGLVKVLVNQGVIKEAGKVAVPAGTRGKPATLYSIPDAVELVFWEENETEQAAQAEEQVKQELGVETATVG